MPTLLAANGTTATGVPTGGQLGRKPRRNDGSGTLNGRLLVADTDNADAACRGQGRPQQPDYVAIGHHPADGG